jgi:hypothetical protein
MSTRPCWAIRPQQRVNILVGNWIGSWNNRLKLKRAECVLDQQIELWLVTLLSVLSDVLLLVALLPQLSLSKPKKENRQAQEENQKP